MDAYLIDGNTRHALTEPVSVIGRDRRTCTITFEDELLSRRHAYIVRQRDDAFIVMDMNSSNGVQVNGRQVTHAPLHDGDTVQLGGIQLTFRLEGKPEPKPAAPAEDIGLELHRGGGGTSDSAEFTRVLREKTLVMEMAKESKAARSDFDKLLILYKVNQIVSSETDMERLLARIAELAMEVFDADRVSITFRTADGKLAPRLQRARDRDEVESGLQHISQSISEHCLAKGEAIVTDDALVDGRFQKSGSIQMFNIRSAMCSPLTHRDRHFGVLYVDNRIQGEVFDEEDLRLLEAFADGVSVAIVNSQLIHELRRSLQQLAQQQEALVQGEKLAAMGQLSAGISHEIRNPLTAISGYVQFYFMKFPPGSPFYDRMQKIEDALEQINGIVEGLLDLARKGEGRMELCSLQGILEATLKISEVSLRRQGKVDIRRDFAEDVPEVIGDRRQLQQVFLNMMVNSSQAMAEGGVLTVRTRRGPPDASGEPTAEVIFEDNGCGIPPEIQATIFHAFVTRGKKGGTGLGLSISKNIVDLHGGTIELESQVGRGTRFTIRLVKDGRAARSEPRDVSLPETPSTPSITGLNGFEDSAPTFSVSDVLGDKASGGESSGSGGEP